MDLKDFFSAAEARTDRWCEMNTVGPAWEAAITQGQPADKLLAQAAQLLGEINALESYWAYPGPRLMATAREAIDEANSGVFARTRAEDLQRDAYGTCHSSLDTN